MVRGADPTQAGSRADATRRFAPHPNPLPRVFVGRTRPPSSVRVGHAIKRWASTPTLPGRGRQLVIVRPRDTFRFTRRTFMRQPTSFTYALPFLLLLMLLITARPARSAEIK